MGADVKVARLRKGPQPKLTSPFGVGGTTPMPALDDLTDVDAPSPADGDVLTFDSGSGTWIPAPASGTVTTMWVPVMTEDTSTGFWYVAVTGDGDAIMTEVPL
jgi:hypothetical protein